ncbi:MBL fold metallo-hydrolase [Thalassobacillus sp. CUG 92003]|uniref:MBL fold metallo-hydrolase n=1 Tax=Thalassobacillus sp. CUG 92003 TaxID=2736641 RepID=UPI0015E76B53|nr:MBL fold metallo-hydrolase [Thalassobacillus sp. CUG 92003]
MKFEKMPLGPLGTNCYIVHDHNQALIVDPGGDFESLLHFLQGEKLVPIAILLTHAHFDHIGAVEDVRNHYSIPVYIHEQEASWLTDARLNGSALFQMGEITTHPPEKYLEPGKLEIGPFQFEIRYTPGHSPGSVSFVFPEQSTVIAGDTLFQSGIGRTDLPGGNMEELLASIQTQIFSLTEETAVLPGHGPNTKVGSERQSNPFFRR